MKILTILCKRPPSLNTVPFGAIVFKQYKLHVLTLVLFCFSNLLHAQYSGFDWFYQIGSDPELKQMTQDNAGNTYVFGSFKDRVILGTDTIKAPVPNTPALFIAKIAKNGAVLVAERLPLNDSDKVKSIEVFDIVLSKSGRVFVSGYIDRAGTGLYNNNYLLSMRPDKSIAFHYERASNLSNSAKYPHIAVDDNNNIYFQAYGDWLGSRDSLGNERWGFYFTPANSWYDGVYQMDVLNNVLYIRGYHTQNVTFFDSSGTSKNLTTINQKKISVAKYSANGKLQDVYSELVPLENFTDYNVLFNKQGKGFFTRHAWQGFGKPTDIYIETFSIKPPKKIDSNKKVVACYGAPSDLFISPYNNYVLNAYGGNCNFKTLFLYDSSLNLLDTITIASAWHTGQKTEQRSFQIDSAMDIVSQSQFYGTLSYAVGNGPQSVSSYNGGDDVFIGKLHEYQTYNPVVTQSGNTLNCSLSGLSYQWLRNGTAVSGATSQSYTPTQTGNYSVTVSDGWECSSISNTIQVTVGIAEVHSSNVIVVYPNPTNGIVRLLGLPSDLTVQVIDVIGKVLHTQISTENTQIDFSPYPSGLYFIKTPLGIQKIQKQ